MLSLKSLSMRDSSFSRLSSIARLGSARLALRVRRMEMPDLVRRLIALCISGTKANCGTKIAAAIRVIQGSIWTI